MDLYDRVVALCASQGITLSELESILGISKGSISKWKKNNPNLITLMKLSDYFNVSLDYLARGTKASSKDDVQLYDLLSPEENNLIIEYRNSDDTTKEMIRRLLTYSEKLNKS